MKHNARIFLFNKFGDFINVVYRTRFVINVNDGHEGGFVVNQIQKIFDVNASVRVQLRETRLHSSLFKLGKTLIHGGVFSARRHRVTAPCKRENRRIIRFAAAGNENKLKAEREIPQNIFFDFRYSLFYRKTAGI